MQILARKEGITSTPFVGKKPTGFSTDSNEPTYMYLIRSAIKARRLSLSFLLSFESQNKNSTWKQWFALERLHNLLSYRSLKSWRRSSDVSLKGHSKTYILTVPYVFSSHDLRYIKSVPFKQHPPQKNQMHIFFHFLKKKYHYIICPFMLSQYHIYFLCQAVICLFLFIYTVFYEIKFSIFT